MRYRHDGKRNEGQLLRCKCQAPTRLWRQELSSRNLPLLPALFGWAAGKETFEFVDEFAQLADLQRVYEVGFVSIMEFIILFYRFEDAGPPPAAGKGVRLTRFKQHRHSPSSSCTRCHSWRSSSRCRSRGAFCRSAPVRRSVIPET